MLRWVLFRVTTFCAYLSIDSAESLRIAGLQLRVMSGSGGVLLNEFFGVSKVFVTID